MIFSLFVSFLLFATTHAIASEEGGSAGKLPASVIATDPELGFRLSDAAIARLGVRFEELKGAGPWAVPKAALVRVKRSTGVYRQSDGFITLVLVETMGTSGDYVRIRSEDLLAGDRIAVSGSGFLRVVELELSGGGGDSCG